MHVGTPVSADLLIDELWGGEPPDGASTTLRSYLSRLRGALGDDVAIDRLPAGYVLQVPREVVDITRFEALVREGQELLERGHHRRAAGPLRRGLELWRGRAFAGLPEDGLLRTEAVRLEELRLNALESRFEADLEVGRGAQLVDELEQLVSAHPFRERLWRHLMLALYRSGRQADALAAYHRARAALDEHLGIEPGEELRELEAAILRQDVRGPAGKSQSMVGVPVPLTSFVGREADLEAVRDLLLRTRLVTLVGVGGVGKTRLAVEAARRAVDDLADGVAFVDLAAVADAALVPAHVAASLRVREAQGQDIGAAVADAVDAADLLLVLDNCEHLRAATATFAQTLLARSGRLRILATSREVLDVAGEATYPVAPLGVPNQDGDPGAYRDSEAVRLLIDRATLTRHGLRVDDAAYATAVRICRELDGLPLAIELAAARTKALSLDEIAERLRDRFQFLVSWRRLTTARHRTLREAMDWSYELLASDEQRLLTRLSVFPAGATVASIAAVCLDGDEGEAERLVERLVDASLLVPLAGDRGTRYRLLETVRQYAAGHLPGSDAPDVARRHAERAHAIAESTNLALERAGSPMSFGLASDELPSIRAAIRWSETADPALGLEIACALEQFWVTNQPREGIAAFTTLLETDAVPDELRARGLRARGGCRFYMGDFDGSTADYEQALAIHRRLGQRAHEAHLLLRLAIEAQRVGDPERARQLLAHAQTVSGERFAPDQYVGLGLASDLAFDDGQVEAGFEILGRALVLAREADDEWWQIDNLHRRADRALEPGAAGRRRTRCARGAEPGPEDQRPPSHRLDPGIAGPNCGGVGTAAARGAALGRYRGRGRAQRAGRPLGAVRSGRSGAGGVDCRRRVRGRCRGGSVDLARRAARGGARLGLIRDESAAPVAALLRLRAWPRGSRRPRAGAAEAARRSWS